MLAFVIVIVAPELLKLISVALTTPSTIVADIDVRPKANKDGVPLLKQQYNIPCLVSPFDIVSDELPELKG